MAAITGITALNFGDGAGGKAALAIMNKKVMDILSSGSLQWRYATMMNPTEVRAGTATFQIPEIIKVAAYNNGTYGAGANSQTPNVGVKTVNLDTRRFAKWEYEMFDASRMWDAEWVIGQISAALANAIQNDLNGQFWLRVRNLFATGGTLTSQITKLSYLGSGDTELNNATTAAQIQAWANNAPLYMWAEYQKLEGIYKQFAQSYSTVAMGVNRNDIRTIMSLQADIDIRTAFRNQPNTTGNWQVDQTLSGKQIGNVRYEVDNMLDLNIAKGTSFNADYDVNLSNVIGIVFHKEAIAMPMNFMELQQTINPNNANPIFIMKYQFGFGILRPYLMKLLLRNGQTLPSQLPTENVN